MRTGASADGGVAAGWSPGAEVTIPLSGVSPELGGGVSCPIALVLVVCGPGSPTTPAGARRVGATGAESAEAGRGSTAEALASAAETPVAA